MQSAFSSQMRSHDLTALLNQLLKIRRDMVALEGDFSQEIDSLHASHRESGRNLIHYMSLRRDDLSSLQLQLASRGLSSLGRSESRVSANLDAVLNALRYLSGQYPAVENDFSDFTAGRSLLENNTAALLGPSPEGRTVRIMVTMPTEAGADYKLVRALLQSGMNCMRVNGAHDNEDVWAHMVENLRRAKSELNRSCKILMDLPGPKLRTGPTDFIPGVIKVKPKRDRFGKVVEPAKVWLTPMEDPQSATIPVNAVLTLSGDWLSATKPGQRIRFIDARGKTRSLNVSMAFQKNRIAECDRTAYVTAETVLKLFKDGCSKNAQLSAIPPVPQPIVLKPGDTLYLASSEEPAHLATRDEHGKYLEPPCIGVTLPEIFSDVQAGEKIWFDDGKIGGTIVSAGPNKIMVEIAKASPKGTKLYADKGINLPDTELQLSALTPGDVARLPFFARYADLIGYSFVRRPSDIHLLQSELTKVNGGDLGIILKIETRKAFEVLPLLLLAAMRSPCAGVMIARGDLAVECGYERTGELQEEIMWIRRPLTCR